MKKIELSDQQIYRLLELLTVRLSNLRDQFKSWPPRALQEALELEMRELKFIQQKLKDARR